MRTVQGDFVMAAIGMLAALLLYIFIRNTFKLSLWQRCVLALGCSAVGVLVLRLVLGNV